MKKLICIIMISCFLLPVMAQNFMYYKTQSPRKPHKTHKHYTKMPEPPFEITKQQMYEDFDQFLHIVETYNAQQEIRKELTHYDAVAALKQRREQIEQVNGYWEFINFMERSLSYTFDVQADRQAMYYNKTDSRYVPGMQRYEFTDIHTVPPAYYRYDLRNSWVQIPSIYLDGEYYINAKVQLAYKGDTIRFQNVKVLEYDNKPMELYIENFIDKLPPSQIRWDFNKQRYYITWLHLDFDKQLKVQDTAGAIYDIAPKRYNVRAESLVPNGLDGRSHNLWAQSSKWGSQHVTYLPEQKVLYIRMGVSTWQENYNLIKAIKKEGMGKQIEKVVIDMRENGKRGDLWSDVLSAIIKEPISFKNKMAMNSNDEVRAFLNAEYPPEVTKEFVEQEISLLGNKKMLVRESISTIEPDCNSLNFDGPIYILQNRAFSDSDNALFSLAQQNSQIISMGMPSGQIICTDFKPWCFRLNHSKFVLKLGTTIDLSTAKKPEDILQCSPEIEVTPTLKEWNEYQQYRKLEELEEYLLKHDYLFKRVMEQ